MSTLAENLITAVKSVAALAGAGCVALLGALYAFQRKLIFAGHAMDIGPALPIRKGRKIEVDVSNEKRPRARPTLSSASTFLRRNQMPRRWRSGTATPTSSEMSRTFSGRRCSSV